MTMLIIIMMITTLIMMMMKMTMTIIFAYSMIILKKKPTLSLKISCCNDDGNGEDGEDDAHGAIIDGDDHD